MFYYFHRFLLSSCVCQLLIKCMMMMMMMMMMNIRFAQHTYLRVRDNKKMQLGHFCRGFTLSMELNGREVLDL